MPRSRSRTTSAPATLGGGAGAQDETQDGGLATFKRYFTEARDLTADARTKSLRAIDYYDSDQFTREELIKLSERNQPPIVINRLKVAINGLVQMMRFVYAGGVRVQGLANRRAAEVALWSTPQAGAATAAPPSSFTRAVATPPLSADARPALKSKSLMTSAASGVAAATVAVTQVSQAVSPYADRNPFVGRAVAGLALAAAVLAALAVVFVWLKKREALT